MKCQISTKNKLLTLFQNDRDHWMSSNPPSNYYATGVLNSLHHSYVRGMLFEKLCCFWEEDWSNVTKLILPLQGWIFFIMARYFLKFNKYPLPPCIICLLQSITSRSWIRMWACKDVHDWSFLNGGTISKDPNSKILRISKWRIHATFLIGCKMGIKPIPSNMMPFGRLIPVVWCPSLL